MNGPFSLLIFFPSGDPNGLRVIEKLNWIGQGLVFPRALFAEVRKREELSRAGVYVLWSPAGDSDQLPRAYVGESDTLLQRLVSHVKKKNFWTRGVVFTSKDRALNKAHVQHLEARLLELAKEAKRCKLDNAQLPQPPSLSEADKAYVEGYLADLLLCLPAVGISFFEKPSAPASSERNLRLRAKGMDAWGYETAEGFVVRGGATAVKNEVRSIHSYLSLLRKRLIDEGVLEDTGTTYKIAQDYTFNSPSQAASVLTGRNTNGRITWKDIEGQSLKEIQEAEAEQP